jgi:hypothetical protein
MQWRVAKSLLALRDQIDRLAPNRDKSSDGTIGDTSHQARKSDHNPDANGVVTAMDITNDPAHGVDSGGIAEMLRVSRDRRIKYVISNSRIFSSQVSPWTWRPYTGVNAHTKHVHVSVIDDPTLYDDTALWSVDQLAKTSPPLELAPALQCTNIVATVFGGHSDPNTSAYDGHLIDDQELGVALPFHFPAPRPRVKVTNVANGKSTVCKIVDVGPWNTNDSYWQSGARPQAESGTDLQGRKTNLAGIDLTPGTARTIGISGKGKVSWEFTTTVVPGQPPVDEVMIAALQLLQKISKDGGLKMPLPADDVSNLLQQLFKLFQSGAASTGMAKPAATPAPASDTTDPIKQIIDLVIGIIVPAVSKQVPVLGQVNGALGETIGNLFNGKKTAIGIFGGLLSTLLPALGATATATAPAGLLAGILPTFAGLPQIGIPISIAIFAWGVLGKLEKWAQGNVPTSQPPK